MHCICSANGAGSGAGAGADAGAGAGTGMSCAARGGRRGGQGGVSVESSRKRTVIPGVKQMAARPASGSGRTCLGPPTLVLVSCGVLYGTRWKEGEAKGTWLGSAIKASCCASSRGEGSSGAPPSSSEWRRSSAFPRAAATVFSSCCRRISSSLRRSSARSKSACETSRHAAVSPLG